MFGDRNVRFLRCGLLIPVQCSGDLLHNQRQCRQKGIQSTELTLDCPKHSDIDSHMAQFADDFIVLVGLRHNIKRFCVVILC